MTDLRTKEPFGNPRFPEFAEAHAQTMLTAKLGEGFMMSDLGDPESFDFHTLIRKPFGEVGVDEYRSKHRIRAA